MGKKERERLKSLPNAVSQPNPNAMVIDGPMPITAQPPQIPRPPVPLDEIASERGVMLLPERGGECE